jgi:hypothetical protein
MLDQENTSFYKFFTLLESEVMAVGPSTSRAGVWSRRGGGSAKLAQDWRDGSVEKTGRQYLGQVRRLPIRPRMEETMPFVATQPLVTGSSYIA